MPVPPPPDGSAPVAVCYRHDDRPTRLSCSSCARPICVDCTRQAAVGQKCPECAAPTGRNRVVSASQIRNRGTLDGAPATKTILAVTVAIGALVYVAPQVWTAISTALIDNVGRVAAGEVYRTVSAALLHSPGSLFHIGFNMYALYIFGPDLERRYGSLPFVLFYMASAAAGGAAFQLANDSGSALGASGAIFGLFGAYVTSAFMSRHTAAGRAGLNQLLPLLLLNLGLPLIIPNIAWEAHVGGLVAGAGMIALWRLADGSDKPTVPVSGHKGRTVLLRSAVAVVVLVASMGVAVFV